MTKTTFFSFIFPIPLSYTSRPSFSIVLCANQKLERKTCNTRATLLWPHLRCDTWDVRKLACSKRSDSGERCEVKKAMKSGPLLLPRFYFFALLFTSHRSPLSERLEQAIRKFVFHPKKSRQFFSLKICIFSLLNICFKFVIGVIVTMLFNVVQLVVCCRPRHVESPCGNLGPV